MVYSCVNELKRLLSGGSCMTLMTYSFVTQPASSTSCAHYTRRLTNVWSRLTHKHSIVAESVPVLQPRLPARRQLLRLCFGRSQSWGLHSQEERIPTGGGRIHKSRAAPERPDGRNLCAPLLRPMAFNATEIPPGAVASALCDPTMCETG